MHNFKWSRYKWKNKSRDYSGEFLVGKIALHLPPRDKKISL